MGESQVEKRGHTPTGARNLELLLVMGGRRGSTGPKAKKTSYYPTLPRKMTLGADHAREGPCWANHRSADGKTQGRLKLGKSGPCAGMVLLVGKRALFRV
jgi:hypothetical protein